jgi:hypothetical protein
MATVTKPDRALIAVLGPLKVEVIQVTAVVDGDTITSKLANPTFALMFSTADAGGTSTNPSVTVSGKTLTLRDPATTTNTVLVFGDSLA